METILKKYRQKFKRIREEMDKWNDLQSRLITQFGNASAIIERFQILRDHKNYGALTCVHEITEALTVKQMDTLNDIFFSMKETMEEFYCIVTSLEKIHRDGNQLVKGGSIRLTAPQRQLRVGIQPSIAICLDGLKSIYEMHLSEYLLKQSILSGLSEIALKSSSSDLSALRQLLIDEPNIPVEEVQYIYDIVLPDEIS